LNAGSVYNVTKGVGAPSDDLCIRIAELVGDDPGKVILLAHKSKASEKARPHWDKILKAVASAVPVLLVILHNISYRTF